MTDMRKDIAKKILKNLNANQWSQVGVNKQGVCVFAVYKDGIHRGTGTLLELSELSQKQS